jgi:ribosomal protein L15E
LGDIKENLSNKKDDATDNLERIKIYGWRRRTTSRRVCKRTSG